MYDAQGEVSCSFAGVDSSFWKRVMRSVRHSMTARRGVGQSCLAHASLGISAFFAPLSPQRLQITALHITLCRI